MALRQIHGSVIVYRTPSTQSRQEDELSTKVVEEKNLPKRVKSKNSLEVVVGHDSRQERNILHRGCIEAIDLDLWCVHLSFKNGTPDNVFKCVK